MSDLLTADAPGIGSLFGGPQWGIFRSSDNSTILAVDSVDSVDYARDYTISDYPQEKGAFESYNKVKTPFRARVGFLIHESRKDFLANIEQAVASLVFVSVVTPDKTYESANLVHYSYRREARAGASMVRVDVWCEEVRVLGEPSTGAPQSTNGETPTQNGGSQTVPPDRTFADDTTLGDTPDDIKGGLPEPT